MGLFDKKYCDICGEKIGLLGNRKLEDGNMCKDCANKLSPFFSDRKSSTVEEIKQQLKYREENAIALQSLTPDRVFGDGKKVYIDTENRKFFVTGATNWKDANPDIIDLSQLISCDVEVVEDRDEIFDTDKEGNKKSYNPRRYEYSYRFEATIRVNSPWFDVIEVELADGNYPDSKFTERYHNLECELYDLKSALTGVRELAPQQQIKEGIEQVFNTILGAAASQNVNTGTYANNVAPNGSWVCSCGTTNTGNFCPNCGNKKPVVPTMIRCDKCGWTTQDLTNPPKFCPNCGDPITQNDAV